MSSSLKENWLEALVGLLVIGVAVWFVTFAYARTGGGGPGDGAYELSARFPSAAGVTEGTDVRVSGLKIGTVTGLKLDPKTFQAVARFSVDGAVKLPIDSTAAITQQGILGGSYVSVVPGGDTAMMKPGGEITDTQGSTDLMGLIGSYINRSGSSAGGAVGAGGAGAATPAGATPPAPK